MNGDAEFSPADVDFAVQQLKKGIEVERLLSQDFISLAVVDAARERIREEQERFEMRMEREAENRDRGGFSCRRCSGFVAPEDGDRFGSWEDGCPPPYCGPCWSEIERPLLRDRLRRAGVPKHFLEAVLCVGRGAPYSRPSGKWFTLIVGPVGVGKTFRAVQLLLDVKDGRFWSLPDLVEARRAAMFGRDENRGGDPLQDAATFRRLLVLDEVGGKLDGDGKPADREFVADTVRRLVLHRYDNELPTVITSNWTLEQLEKGYGEKVGSRLAECAHVVTMQETRDRRRLPQRHLRTTAPDGEPTGRARISKLDKPRASEAEAGRR